MKLQNLAIIFILIVVPIALVMGLYVRGQGNTITLQNQYDSFLSNANYDAVSAYKINTHDNELVGNADSIREDIEASTNTFMRSMASNLNISQDDVKVYVPAMLYSLYDGYYIYSAVKNNETGKIEYALKPYVYYTEQIKNDDVNVVINYTLDNYIAIYGVIHNFDGEERVISISGYLIDTNKYEEVDGNVFYTINENNKYKIEKEELKENIEIRYKENELDTEYKYTLLENVPYKYINQKKVYYIEGQHAIAAKVEKGWYTYSSTRGELVENDYNSDEYDGDDSAIKYYQEAYKFTKTLLDEEDMEGTVIGTTGYGLAGKEGLKEFLSGITGGGNDPEDYNSEFCQHKREVIRKSIEKNLKNAIDNFSSMSQAGGTTYNYKMPILLEEDWEKIYSEVCMTAFFQGLPIGFKTYNNYDVIPVTGNTQYVNPSLLYFIGNDGEYHKITCDNFNFEESEGESLRNTGGYRSKDFEAYRIQTSNPDESLDETVNKEAFEYYYKHADSGDYNCIIEDRTNKNVYKNGYFSTELISSNNATAYFTTLARERYNLYKATGYLNDAFDLDKSDLVVVDPEKPNYNVIVQYVTAYDDGKPNDTNEGIVEDGYDVEISVEETKENTTNTYNAIIGRYAENTLRKNIEEGTESIIKIKAMNNRQGENYYSLPFENEEMKVTITNDDGEIKVDYELPDVVNKYGVKLVYGSAKTNNTFTDSTGNIAPSKEITISIIATPITKYNVTLNNVDEDGAPLDSYEYTVQTGKHGNIWNNKEFGFQTSASAQIGDIYGNDASDAINITLNGPVSGTKNDTYYKNLSKYLGNNITININLKMEKNTGNELKHEEMEVSVPETKYPYDNTMKIVVVDTSKTGSGTCTSNNVWNITITIFNIPKIYVTSGEMEIIATIKSKNKITLKSNIKVQGEFKIFAFIKDDASDRKSHKIAEEPYYTGDKYTVNGTIPNNTDWYNKEWQLVVCNYSDEEPITSETPGVKYEATSDFSADNNGIKYMNDKVSWYELDRKDSVTGLSMATNAGAITKRTSATISPYRTYNDNGTRRIFNVTKDISGVGNITPIPKFQGIFDGQNNTISGITINSPSNKDKDKNKYGLFATNEGKIENLTLINVTVNNTDNKNKSTYTGGIIGYNNSNEVTGLKVQDSTITGGTYLGGIIGYSRSGVENLTIENSKVQCNGDSYANNNFNGLLPLREDIIDDDDGTNKPDHILCIGGAIGYIGGEVRNITSTKTDVALKSKYTVDCNFEKGSEKNSDWYNDLWNGGIYSNFTNNYIGGIIGYTDGGISDAYIHENKGCSLISADVDVTLRVTVRDDSALTGVSIHEGVKAFMGGIAGTCRGNITDAHIDNIEINGTDGVTIKRTGDRTIFDIVKYYSPTYVGGIVGLNGNNSNWTDVTIEKGNLKGENNVGGVAGKNLTELIANNNGLDENDKVTLGEGVKVSGKYNVGGIVGYNKGTIEGFEFKGKVNNGANIGGIVGYNNGGTIYLCTNRGTITTKDNECNVDNTASEQEEDNNLINENNGAGGICGFNYEGIISSCGNYGNVTGNVNVGGIVRRLLFR